MMKKRPKTERFENDVNILQNLLKSEGAFDEFLQAEDMKNRKLFLTEEVSQFSVEYIVRAILRYNAEDADIPEDRRRPVILYLASNGGDVDAGYELIDVIQTSATPVYTINVGNLYSMGALIGIAGKKRFAFPNAKYLIHDGTDFIYNSGSKAQDQMKFHISVERHIREFILKNTRISEEEYDEKVRHEWYMFVDEAKEKGLVDYIIGVDVPLAEILN